MIISSFLTFKEICQATQQLLHIKLLATLAVALLHDSIISMNHFRHRLTTVLSTIELRLNHYHCSNFSLSLLIISFNHLNIFTKFAGQRNRSDSLNWFFLCWSDSHFRRLLNWFWLICLRYSILRHSCLCFSAFNSLVEDSFDLSIIQHHNIWF